MTNSTRTLEIDQIRTYLPHRYPFLLIDRVLDYTPGEQLLGLKNVTVNEPCFTGHFPQTPVLPGVLIVEALAQASVLLSLLTEPQHHERGDVCLLVGLNNARFKAQVKPGDQLHLHTQITRYKLNIWRFQAEARVSESAVCQVEIMSTFRAL